MANQGNYVLGHFDRLSSLYSDDTDSNSSRGGNRSIRKGLHRKLIGTALLGWLYHKTVIDLTNSNDLLCCVLKDGTSKPTLSEILRPKLQLFKNAFHDKWYFEHKRRCISESVAGNFEMYDGQWTMVRATCAVD